MISFRVGFSRVTFRQRKISKNDFFKLSPTTPSLLTQTTLNVEDSSTPSGRNHVRKKPQTCVKSTHSSLLSEPKTRVLWVVTYAIAQYLNNYTPSSCNGYFVHRDCGRLRSEIDWYLSIVGISTRKSVLETVVKRKSPFTV